MDFGSEMSVDHADISNYESRLTQDLPFKQWKKDGRYLHKAGVVEYS